MSTPVIRSMSRSRVNFRAAVTNASAVVTLVSATTGFVSCADDAWARIEFRMIRSICLINLALYLGLSLTDHLDNKDRPIITQTNPAPHLACGMEDIGRGAPIDDIYITTHIMSSLVTNLADMKKFTPDRREIDYDQVVRLCPYSIDAPDGRPIAAVLCDILGKQYVEHNCKIRIYKKNIRVFLELEICGVPVVSIDCHRGTMQNPKTTYKIQTSRIDHGEYIDTVALTLRKFFRP